MIGSGGWPRIEKEEEGREAQGRVMRRKGEGKGKGKGKGTGKGRGRLRGRGRAKGQGQGKGGEAGQWKERNEKGRKGGGKGIW